MTKLLQAADAAALVRKNIDRAAQKSLDSILEFIEYAANDALTHAIDSVHPNPDVQEGITKKLESLGYKVELIENNEIKISWSK